MSRASPAMRQFARRLIECESTKIKSHEAFPGPERLRPSLTALMGSGGFRALLSRALALASAEVRWLRVVQVKADGTFEGAEALYERIDPSEFREGRVVLLAQLLGLLVAFIGANLTARLVKETWPRITLDDLELANEREK